MTHRARTAATHPFGLTILLCSGCIGGLLLLMPGLERWSERSVWIWSLGVAAYLLSAAVVVQWPPSAPEVRRLRAIRRNVSRLLQSRVQSAPPEVRPELERLTAGALDRIQAQLLPAFGQLADHAAALRTEIKACERQRPAPDAELLNELRAIQARLTTARASCVQRAVNGEAKLVALVQERNSELLAQRLQDWVDDLADLHEAAQAVIRGTGPLAVTVLRPASGPDQPAAVAAPAFVPAPLPVGPADDFVDLIKQALRNLNKPANLARSELITRLPGSLHRLSLERSGAGISQATPLMQGQLLRALLIDAIERLKVADGEGDREALHYHILHKEYVQGMSNKQIMIRHDLPESSFYRYWSAAVEALAHELWRQEQLTAHRFDPVALDYLG